MQELFGLPIATLMWILVGAVAVILVAVGALALRNPLIFKLGTRNIGRRKAQTVLIVTGLMLSTLIIATALGVGDTINYSANVQAYNALGPIDLRADTSASSNSSGGGGGFSFGGPGAGNARTLVDAATGTTIAAQVAQSDDVDGVIPVLIDNVPVSNPSSDLFRPSVTLHGLGAATGGGFGQLALVDGGAADWTTLGAGQAYINQTLATQLEATTGATLEITVRGQPTSFTVAGIVADGGLAGDGTTLVLPLAEAQTLFGATGKISSILVSNTGDRETGVERTDSVLATLETAIAGTPLQAQPLKRDALDAAAESAGAISSLFVIFGSFSILAGVLLIFLIFVVLAAERRSEMGMARAIGVQQGQLVQMFVYEGLIYDMIAAAVGAALGVGTALLIGQGVAALLDSVATSITPHVEFSSIVVAYCLGVVITFITVTVSAIQVSKINIIAAIRDLNLPPKPLRTLGSQFKAIGTTFVEAWRSLFRGRVLRFITLLLIGFPLALWRFVWGLTNRGILTLALGVAVTGLGCITHKVVIFGSGMSLMITGIGLLIKWLTKRERAGMTFIGLGLIIFWSLPLQRLQPVFPRLEGGIGDFFVIGVLLVVGAILLLMYNADRVIDVFSRVLGRSQRILPMVRTAVAYPLSNKFRTGVTVAMISLIIFTLVSVATISETFSQFLSIEGGSAGYDLAIQTSYLNPIPDLNAALQTKNGVDRAQIEAIGALATLPATARNNGAGDFKNTLINGADAAFLRDNKLNLTTIAEGYADEAAVWAALQADPTLAVVDSTAVPAPGAPFSAAEDAYQTEGIITNAKTMTPLKVQIKSITGQQSDYTIIGVFDFGPTYIGMLINSDGAAKLGIAAPSRFVVRLADGADTEAIAKQFERTFRAEGVQTTLLVKQIEEARASTVSTFYLIQAFIAIGLLVGIAALGVLAVRSVVERRQQIGMLRAIGFERGMVQGTFLLDSMFVATLGIVIGFVLGLSFAYNLYTQVVADQGFSFDPPWITLTIVVVGAFLASLLMTYFPARSAARTTIATALRYE